MVEGFETWPDLIRKNSFPGSPWGWNISKKTDDQLNVALFIARYRLEVDYNTAIEMWVYQCITLAVWWRDVSTVLEVCVWNRNSEIQLCGSMVEYTEIHIYIYIYMYTCGVNANLGVRPSFHESHAYQSVCLLIESCLVDRMWMQMTFQRCFKQSPDRWFVYHAFVIFQTDL